MEKDVENKLSDDEELAAIKEKIANIKKSLKSTRKKAQQERIQEKTLTPTENSQNTIMSCIQNMPKSLQSETKTRHRAASKPEKVIDEVQFAPQIKIDAEGNIVLDEESNWSIEETLRFYQALSIVGTDFTLLRWFLPKFDRNQLK
ncbi:hypothetical protein MXB_404, partial [Myxobolus squamalis]